MKQIHVHFIIETKSSFIFRISCFFSTVPRILCPVSCPLNLLFYYLSLAVPNPNLSFFSCPRSFVLYPVPRLISPVSLDPRLLSPVSCFLSLPHKPVPYIFVFACHLWVTISVETEKGISLLGNTRMSSKLSLICTVPEIPK
jgi:hypothetical protein